MKTRFYISLSLLILLASYRCSGSSEIEMTQARDAMDHAKSLHADTLASTDFQQAQKAWDSAQAAEKDGKTSAAKVLFTSARIFFDKAADIAKSRQDALSRELNGMQLMIGKNFDQVRIDLSRPDLSPRQRSQVKAIASEVEEDNEAISELVLEEDFVKAVAIAKDVQTKIYHAQLILAGKKIK
jgi:hypothetical protein